jgi:multicomponent Na+:H+ antiporter subunit C
MISVTVFYTLGGVVLFATGLYALIVYSHLLRKILAINVCGSGVFLCLVATAHRVPDAAPDPVPHAMVLTGIVVAVSATALALALTCHFQKSTGRITLPEDEQE